MFPTNTRPRPWFHWGMLTLMSIGLSACNPSNTPSVESKNQDPNSAATVQQATGPTFRFSSMEPVTGGTLVDNWCKGRFNEPVVVNAEKENTNRRYFYLRPGITMVAIGPSGMTAIFMVRPVGNGVVEIFNGAHLPECLSMPSNFSPASAGPVVHYRNHQNLNFSIEVREEDGFSLITVELPPGNRYGMDISHCSNCE